MFADTPVVAPAREHTVSRFFTLAVVILLVTTASVWAQVPSDAVIHKILAERVGHADGVGIVVGVVDKAGRRIITYGNGPRPFDGDTLFEIGSVTKVFTALLLADMVQRGEVALDDPVTKYLPATVRVPARNGHPIRLVDLATHTSALPFMTDEAPTSFLAKYVLRRDPGEEWDYSNLGYWLLNQALTSRAGVDYENLLHARITGPLKLRSTVVTVTPKLASRLAQGYDSNLQPAPRAMSISGYADMAAAGGIVSSTNDLLSFLSLTMGLGPSPRAAASAAMLVTRRPIGNDSEQALGWVVRGKDDQTMIAHDGGTPGFASAVAWDPRQRVGVTVLMNVYGDVSDIAYHLLQPDIPLKEVSSPVKRTEILLDAATLDSYTGRYEAAGEGTFVITRDGNALAIEAPPDWGLPKMNLYPESPRDFFGKEIPLRASFRIEREGTVKMIVFPPRGQNAIPTTRAQDR